MKTYKTEYKGFIVYYNDIFQLEAEQGLIDAGNTWAYERVKKTDENE